MKKITLLFLLFLATSYSSYSQVEIGTGTTVKQYTPYQPSASYSYAQTIYLASEINAKGTITAIKWYYNGMGPLLNSRLVIYLGNTSQSSYSSRTNWVTLPNLTKVYEGNIAETFPFTAGWVRIPLDIPFAYNGTDNLVIAVDDNKEIWDDGSAGFYNTEVVDSRSIYIFSDNKNPDPASPIPPIGYEWQNSTSNYIPNIIFEGISQSCPSPKNLTSSDITTTTATVSWTSPTVNPADGSDVYISTLNTPPTNNTTPAASISSGTSFTFSSLIPGTEYFVWARNNCGVGNLSSWSEPTNFTTECIAISNFVENFDNTTTPNLPICWTKIISGPSVSEYATIETSGYPEAFVYSAPNSLFMASNGTNTDENKIILVSPKLNTLNSGYRLKFFAKSGKYDSNLGRIEIGTLSNNTSTAVFTSLQVNTLSKESTEYTANFDSYSGTDTYIGIKMYNQNQDQYSNIYLDNLVWEKNPTCPDATKIIIPSVSPNSATITWENDDTPASWDVAVGLSTETNPDALAFVNTTTNSATINDLEDNKTYKVWVRSVCEGNDIGQWSYPVEFTTDCIAVNLLDENFESTLIDELPTCWTSIIRGANLNSDDYVKVQDYDPTKSPKNYVSLNNSNSGIDNEIILVTPNLSTLNGAYRLKFYAKYYGGASTNYNLEIGTVSSSTPYGTFTPINYVTINGPMKEYIYEFGYTGTDTHIGFKIINNGSFSSIHLDNIVWEPIPTCPDVADIVVPYASTNGATIAWTANGKETTWDVAVGPEFVTDPNELSYVNSNTNTIEISDLSDNTTYNVWVRTVCTSENGAWIGPVTFTTPCMAVSYLNENFDEVTTPNLPNCWSKIIRGISVSEFATIVTTNYPLVHSEPNNVAIENSTSNATDDIILVSPNLTNTTEQPFSKYRLKFYAKRPSYNSNIKIEVGTLSSNTNSAEFSPIETVEIGSSSEQFVVNFSAYTGTDTFLGLKLSAPSNSSVNIDNIVWELAPNCPDVKKINIPKVTASTATIVWTPGGNETTWNVAYSSTATDPNELPYSTVTNPTENISDLTDNTSYNVWVRSVCDSENGAWIGPVTFKTACLPVVTLNENFDSVSTPNLPSCWSKIIRGSGVSPWASVVTNTYTAVVSPPNCVSAYSDSSNNPYEIILVTPSLSNLTDPQFKLSFDVRGNGSIEVGTLDSNTDTATFNSIESFTTTSEFQQISTDLKSYSGTDTYIGIRATPSFYGEIGFDNVIWNTDLSTNNFDQIKLNYYPNPVKNILNINYLDNISAVSVYNLLGQEVMVKSINENNAKIDMSSLTKGTYLVKVTANNLVKTIKVLKD